ncbi:MAG: nuclear transport factor 2 family protein [Actinobacteria bacterium]|nr:nuclear transport factor 2 family protein [Actinomycetota bacterium]
MSALFAAPTTIPDGALQTTIAFAAALRDGNLAGALVHFDDSARLLTADGTEVSGHEAIGDVLADLIGCCHEIEISPGRTIVAGAVAHCTQSWRLVVADDTSYRQGTKATLVLHQIDERWQIVIAAPWG